MIRILAVVTLSAFVMTVLFAVLLLSGQERLADFVPARRSLLLLPETPKPQMHLLSLSYMDQMTWAAKRLKSLQCWASMWQSSYDVRVVEPFVTNGTHLGVPIDIARTMNRTLRFSTLFDITSWNSDHAAPLRYPELISWDYFLDAAPRNVVVVQLVYKNDYRCTENEFAAEACSEHLIQSISRLLKDFTIVDKVCINFRLHNTLSLGEFNDLIFRSVPKDTPITVVFNEWRGTGKRNDDIANQCLIRISNGSNCTPNGQEFVANLTSRVLVPSLKIKKQAEEYISRYLTKESGYLAVMVRWEKVFLYGFYDDHESQYYAANNCTRLIKEHAELINSEKGIDSIFISTDIGRYGSSTFALYNSTRDILLNLTSYTEDLMRTFLHLNDSTSLAEYERRFVEVSGTTNRAVISQLQKAIAANARCLLLVGLGAFHDNTMKMYRKVHPRVKDRCLKVVQTC